MKDQTEHKARYKIFIDGSEGTTGLRIHERFAGRDDLRLLPIDPQLRKDPAERKRLIAESDITFLCLPDAAAAESAALWEDCGNETVRLIDTSTAHRTLDGWAYGFPELSAAHRRKIADGKKIAVPGCHATGFLALAYPLLSRKILPADYPVSCFSITGYSGGGKAAIAKYQAKDRDPQLLAPQEYALSQQHKHLKEMRELSGLSRLPLFSPIIADYYSGMVVSVPLYSELLDQKPTPVQLRQVFAEYYEGEPFIRVMPFGAEERLGGMMAGNGCSGWDGLELYVTGNKDRILLTARFDNLGKGASGAAVQCLNLMLGCGEAKGLQL
ncbi:MAG: N-acetyl-gamma-glutamyl-phosphate reductase [Clostridium sp.]|jgi:N-acetyl-gamma-glutamyl-phosphate reductase|nr:N-acetyl-gamma-glutamyl-phosphate reductase [Clostridium sp.]